MSEILNKTNEQESTLIETVKYSKESIENAKKLIDLSFNTDGVQRADILVSVYKILCANLN